MEQTTPRRAPYVSVTGTSGAGASTFAEGLAGELASRGWRVALLGSGQTAVSTASIIRMSGDFADEPAVAAVAERLADDVDLVIADGLALGGRRCVEVSRASVSEVLVCEPGDALAVVTDNEAFDPFAMSLYALDDFDYVADAIEERFLSGGDRRER